MFYKFFPQLLRVHEHMVTAASQGVILLIQTFGDKFVLTEIIKEISRMSRSNIGKDASASGMRNFTQFLTEVSSSCPQMIMPSLSLLMTFLDEEVSFTSKIFCLCVMLHSIRLYHGSVLNFRYLLQLPYFAAYNVLQHTLCTPNFKTILKKEKKKVLKMPRNLCG